MFRLIAPLGAHAADERDVVPRLLGVDADQSRSLEREYERLGTVVLVARRPVGELPYLGEPRMLLVRPEGLLDAGDPAGAGAQQEQPSVGVAGEVVDALEGVL